MPSPMVFFQAVGDRICLPGYLPTAHKHTSVSRQTSCQSRARGKPACFQRGFTLIEILVVLVIIGIVSILAVVNFERSSAQLVRDTAEKLSIAFENARDRAIISGHRIGISSDGTGYQFWKADETGQQWDLLSDDEALSVGQFPHDVELKTQESDGQAQKIGQRIVFEASGLGEPFAWMLQSGSSQIWVVMDALGRVEVKDAL